MSQYPKRCSANALLRENGFRQLVKTAKQVVATDQRPVGIPEEILAADGKEFGDYELLEEISRGGMGVVFKARHKKLDRVCALKMILAGQLASDEDVRRFHSEAEAAAGLDHPGIVAVYDVGQVGEQHFYSMGFVQGTSLAHELRDGPFDPERAAKLTKQIAEAIAYAHDRNVIHRDLKPANILLDSNGQTRITDFGLAKKTQADSNLTATGQILGTPSFMPPEQASGKLNEVNERADVYSLGAILYTLLTGRPPFQAASAMDTLMQVLNQEPLPPSKLVSQIPRDLETICLKSLRKESDKRYKSAGELADDLDRWLENKPITARRVNSVEKAWLWSKRRPALVGTIAIAVIVVTAVTLYLVNRKNEAEAKRIVEGLSKADTSHVAGIIEQLNGYRFLANDDLQKAFDGSPENSSTKLHAALAMLADHKSVIPFLKERLLTVAPMQFEYVRDLLNDDKEELVNYYWEIAKESKDSALRFQAACALAMYDPENEHWKDSDFQDFVAGHLVGVRPSELLPWTNALRPVKDHLTNALSTIYRSPDAERQFRLFATDTLADYFSADAERLFELLADANEKQFAPLFDKLKTHADPAIKLGNAEFSKTLPNDASEADKESLAMRQANAAILLLLMDADDEVWPLLKHSPNPRVRSYLIHWLRPRDGNPKTVIARYEKESNVTIKRALLLCLGEFELTENEKHTLIKPLLDTYQNHPDHGLHAAIDWLLRQWEQHDKISAIDIELSQTAVDFDSKQFNARMKNDHSKIGTWYINSQLQTMCVLDAGEFMMGSPDSEYGHQQDERFHRRMIERRIAIGNKEITKRQWRAFYEDTGVLSPDQDKFRPYLPHEDCPMVGMTWFEAAYYCNWLSEREGIPKNQWCYEPNERGEFDIGMRAKDKFWDLAGYRLPTEAEWEFACRAAAETSRYYGNIESLLLHYAWYLGNGGRQTHSVGSLKPNDFGLFDMHGNVFEWCFDVYGNYPDGSKTGRADLPTNLQVLETDRRLLRGSAFRSRADDARSAFRNHDQPIGRHMDGGFRCVRTCRPISSAGPVEEDK